MLWCPAPWSVSVGETVLLKRQSAAAKIVHRPGLSPAILAEVARFTGPDYLLCEVSDQVFQNQLQATYQHDNQVAEQVAEDMGTDINLNRLAEEIPESEDLIEGENDAPVIKLINAIISQAVRDKASDIHIETFEDRLSVRYRIDGLLTEVLSPKRLLGPMLISRIKVMSRMDIAEKRLPQDGRISVKLAGHGIDIRVSTLPSIHGERVVLRLLDKQAGNKELHELRMPEEVLNAYAKALGKPHGIILVTGPTGSGKTTTLYSGLMHINDRQQNILTIEDPIEYSLPGIGQTQVNTKINMTFANGLRSILRQDPDVVMLGEIRDTETAKIAVQASLTGHLVLSTLHTNTAAGAITRLQDMGIEPFLLASSLDAVIAQRLIRLLCPQCKERYTPEESELAMFDELGRPEALYKANGCQSCKHTGYQDRMAIFEIIEVDDKLRKLIHDHASEEDLVRHARKGQHSIFQNGLTKVANGNTTIDEVLRVTSA